MTEDGYSKCGMIRQPATKTSGLFLWMAVIVLSIACLSVGVEAREGDDPEYQEPNHLVPIDPYPWSQEYHQFVFNELLGDLRMEERLRAWMLVTPSFEAEYAVALYRVDSADSSEAFWELEYAEFEDNTWYQMEWAYKPEKVLSKKVLAEMKPRITRKIAVVPDSVAANIMRVWNSVVSQTSYEEVRAENLDGTTYQFFAWPDMYGETWSPGNGVPRLMVDLGQALIGYTKAEKKKQAKTLDSIATIISTIDAQMPKQ